ncbi:hypothetical protein FMM05_20310 [Flavobacterium zepuense]|uniref:Lipoprotein n=1 Tax=Flavobacterium zepuense TaxID=2593302 RepID=A0A552UTE2_9FLAO|nr:hypothetical protein [Flavobacterium zepuense]TRW21496.1 hypothetical protein FMM05_20310 [Flavobacterium zepuense]
MKTLSFILLFATILLTGCDSKELSKDEALQLLKKELGYPRTVDRSIFCRDQGHARKVFAAGLEKSGMVTINENLTVRDVIAKKPIMNSRTRQNLTCYRHLKKTGKTKSSV